MANIELNARVQNKIDTQANWDAQTDFVPLAGEIIIYNDINNFKIGDGITRLNDLKFQINSELNKITDILEIESNLSDGLKQINFSLTSSDHTGGIYIYSDSELYLKGFPLVLSGVNFEELAIGNAELREGYSCIQGEDENGNIGVFDQSDDNMDFGEFIEKYPNALQEVYSLSCNNGRISDLKTPYLDSDAANKQYVDNKVQEAINRIIEMYPIAEEMSF